MPKPVNLGETLDEVLSREARWAQRRQEVWGLDTGFRSLNRLVGGLQPGLTYIGARTSHGKSAWGMQVSLHAAEAAMNEWETAPAGPCPGKVLIYSPEMTPEQLMERYATMRSGVPAYSIKRGHADDAERLRWQACAADLASMAPALRLYAGDEMTFEEIVGSVEAAIADDPSPVRLVFIDYLQLIRLGTLLRGGEYEAITTMAKQLKVLANRFRIPFLVASQLNRSIEKDHQGQTVERPPELSDFKGSGAIEETADMAILLWRPPEPVLSAEPGAAQKATLYVKKNRDGAVGSCSLHFYPRLVMFADAGEPPRRDGGLQ